MSRNQQALFDGALLRTALVDALKKLDPRTQWRNPVMFVVWLGSVVTTLLAIAIASGKTPGETGFTSAIAVWLWFTVLFANFAEALAEGRSKAQANSLKGVTKTIMAKKLAEAKYGASHQPVAAESLRKGDRLLVEAGDTNPL